MDPNVYVLQLRILPVGHEIRSMIYLQFITSPTLNLSALQTIKNPTTSYSRKKRGIVAEILAPRPLAIMPTKTFIQFPLPTYYTYQYTTGTAPLSSTTKTTTSQASIPPSPFSPCLYKYLHYLPIAQTTTPDQQIPKLQIPTSSSYIDQTTPNYQMSPGNLFPFLPSLLTYIPKRGQNNPVSPNQPTQVQKL
ncbi:hypothetical protein L873DRAFT_1785174 [Choiromyces venosus 120613-1]|uniref:Uncharacterized protein n=1 Tax=Choiromyces venosus 120613-1 TaxID=1336337 RepID=A0A3N4K9D0_9PEZI|nr:hypothetical protein L873DRAFT_1785174 [Choiromyces venosus 120613-1]